mgnify:CR=1 FL=1
MGPVDGILDCCAEVQPDPGTVVALDRQQTMVLVAAFATLAIGTALVMSAESTPLPMQLRSSAARARNEAQRGDQGISASWSQSPTMLATSLPRQPTTRRRIGLRSRDLIVPAPSSARPASMMYATAAVAAARPLAVAEMTETSKSGIAIDQDGRVVIVDFAAWFQFAPDAIEAAIADGAGGADGILIHVMRRALPRLRWPPDPAGPIGQQWPVMTRLIAERLVFDPEPEPVRPSSRLRLI